MLLRKKTSNACFGPDFSLPKKIWKKSKNPLQSAAPRGILPCHRKINLNPKAKTLWLKKLPPRRRPLRKSRASNYYLRFRNHFTVISKSKGRRKTVFFLPRQLRCKVAILLRAN
jgi:hypothetical protein